MADSPIKKFLEAGVQLSDVSRKQAEAVVKTLVKAGEVRRKDGEELVQTLIERGRETSEHIAAAIQKEVAKQVDALKAQFEGVEARVDELSRQLRGDATPTEKAPAQQGSAKPASAKQARAKQARAKPGSAKPGSAKQAVGSSGVRKVSTTRQA